MQVKGISKKRIFSLRALLATCFACLFLSSCGLQFPRKGNVSYFTHTIKYPGETLWLISSWYTGNGNNWKVIKKHNPNIQYKNLRQGVTLSIPESLVVRRKALPKPKVAPRTSGTRSTSGTSTGSNIQVPPEDDIWIDPIPLVEEPVVPDVLEDVPLTSPSVSPVVVEEEPPSVKVDAGDKEELQEELQGDIPSTRSDLWSEITKDAATP